MGKKIDSRQAMLALLNAALLLASAACASGPPAEGPRETVFLIHGMGRSRLSMSLLGARLRREGFRTVNVPYSQTTASFGEISAALRRRAAAAGGGRYHLVGHSLGAVVIREGFREGYPPGLGRVVMLAPPNSPPHLALKLGSFAPYRWLCGDSGRKLADPAFYAALPVPAAEFAVLAGDRGSRLNSEEPNDGVVTVAETRLEGMKAFKVLRRTHTFLMNAPETAPLVASFLKTGSF